VTILCLPGYSDAKEPPCICLPRCLSIQGEIINRLVTEGVVLRSQQHSVVLLQRPDSKCELRKSAPDIGRT